MTRVLIALFVTLRALLMQFFRLQLKTLLLPIMLRREEAIWMRHETSLELQQKFNCLLFMQIRLSCLTSNLYYCVVFQRDFPFIKA